LNTHKLRSIKSILVLLMFILLIFSLTSCYSVQSLFKYKITEEYLGYYLRLETDPEEKDYGTAKVLLLKEVHKSCYVIQEITRDGYRKEEYKVKLTGAYDDRYYADIQLPSEEYSEDIELSKGDERLPSYMTELHKPQAVDESVPYIIIGHSFGDVYFKIAGIETPEDINNLEAAFIANEKTKEAEEQARLEKQRSERIGLINKSKEFLIELLANKKMYLIPQTSSFNWNGPELFRSELLPDGETMRLTSLSNNPYVSGRIFLLSWPSEEDVIDYWVLLGLGGFIDLSSPAPVSPTVNSDLGGEYILKVEEGETSNLRKTLNMYELESDHTIYLTKDRYSVDLFILLEDE